MRLIDAEALEKIFEERISQIEIDGGAIVTIFKASMEVLLKDVKSQPTIEAKPVVYCKDCEYFNPHCQSCFLHWQEDDEPNVFCFQTNPDDYCSFAEKRDNKCDL